MTWAALQQKSRTMGTDSPPLLRAVAIASLHLTAFIAICALSYARLPMGSTVAAAVLALLALSSPLSGMLFVLIAVNFQYLFWFDPGALYRIDGVVSVAYIVRALPITLKEGRQGTWLWFVLLAFIGLVVLHLFPLDEPGKSIQAIGFLVLTATLFLHCRSIAGTPDAAVAAATLCISGFAACVLSFAHLYVPLPELFLSHSPLYDLHLNELRLSGAQENPNAIAKLALPGILALVLLTIARYGSIALWILLLSVGSIVLASAGSKSVLLALVPVMLVLLVFAVKRRRLRGWAIAAIAVSGSVLLFSAAVLPSVKYHAADFWEKYSEPKISAALYGKLAQDSYLSRLRSEFRIRVSRQVHCADPGSGGCLPDTPGPVSANDIGGRGASAGVAAPGEPSAGAAATGQPAAGGGIAATGHLAAADGVAVMGQPSAGAGAGDPGVDDGIAATGQRLLIFKTGLAIVYNHLWWGIGYKHWPTAMQEINGIPFVSPHNGLLEVWGSYGVLGAIVYLALIGAAARNYVTIENRLSDPTISWLNGAIALFLLALFIHETVEVATVLAVTPYALWAWAALGLQDGILRQSKHVANREVNDSMSTHPISSSPS